MKKNLFLMLTTLSMLLQAAPVFAEYEENLEIRSDPVGYYNENFSGLSTGTLVNMGSGTNESYTTSNGLKFTCGTRTGDSDKVRMDIGYTASLAFDGNYIFAYADPNKSYNSNNARKPVITLTRMDEVTFDNDVVISFAAKFSNTSSGWVLSDGTNRIKINTSTISNLQTGVWYKFEVVSGDEETIIIAKDTENVLKGMAKSATLLTNIRQIESDGGNNLNAYLDDLVVEDKEYVLPYDAILDAAVDALAITEGQMGMTVSGDVYHVKRDVVLPEDPDGTTVEWSVSQRPINDDTAPWEATSFASPSDGILVLNASEDSSSYYVKLTATVTSGELSDTKDFLFVIEELSEDEKGLKYDEDFSGVAAGPIVDLGNNSNTDYKYSLGVIFGCGSREAYNTALGIRASTDTDKGTYIDFYANMYQMARQPYITLTRSQGTFEKGIYVSADVRYASADCGFVIRDSEYNTVTVNVPDEEYLNKWLNVTVAVVGTAAQTVIKDDDGNILYYGYESTKLKNVKDLTTTDTNAYSSFSIDNLYIADKEYKAPDSEIVRAVKDKLDLDLTKDGSVYNASTDFDLPEAPTGATVSWKAMQKAKSGGDWEDSQFIAVSGSTAVIKPTNVINDYDVKLVAEITSGEATDTKDFAIALPNPMDEINGILNNNFNIVNTTDTDSENKTITFDLNGTDMLKRDLALPISVKRYKNTTIAWTSSDEEHITIDKNGIATLMTSDFSEHEVTLTAVVTYKKNDVTYSSDPQEFTVKMGFEETDANSGDDTMGKYRVRYDAAYEDNFQSIPMTATSNIDLPTAGYFGSTFTWTSSAPTVISNAGKVTRPSNTRTVDLTAAIISGSASAQARFNVEVRGTGSSGGGGGGGSSTAQIGDGTLTVSGEGDMDDYAYGTAPWYSRRSEIKSIVIENGITSVGSWAFFDCSQLESAAIADSVTRIGDWAFGSCSGLSEITIPGSVTAIGDWAFFGCSGLSEIIIPESVTAIGGNAFPKTAMLMGYRGSYAQEYAEANGYSFTVITDTKAITRSTITRAGEHIVVATAADKSLTDKVLHIALYDGADALLDHISVPTTISDRSAYIVFKDDPRAAYAKVFVWDSIDAMIPNGRVERVEIE